MSTFLKLFSGVLRRRAFSRETSWRWVFANLVLFKPPENAQVSRRSLETTQKAKVQKV